jgi:hypothetical protein
MSEMQDLAHSPRGKMARTQEDLVKIATGDSTFKEEIMADHPLAIIGFSQFDENDIHRMSDGSFREAIRNLMKCRPSAHMWSVLPLGEDNVKEDRIFIESEQAFKLTFDEKASILQEEWIRRPRMVGFKLELHNVNNKLGMTQVKPSVSLSVYEADEFYPGTPLEIRVRYRNNW